MKLHSHWGKSWLSARKTDYPKLSVLFGMSADWPTVCDIFNDRKISNFITLSLKTKSNCKDILGLLDE